MKFYQKTWFIVLSLLLFAPLGVFLMWKYKPWHKAFKITLSVLLLLFFLAGAIGTLSIPQTAEKSHAEKPGSTETSTEPITASSSDATEETESANDSSTDAAEETNKEQITNVVNDEFGKENVIFINYVPSNNYLLIEAKGIESITSKTTVKGMYLSIYNILKGLADLKDINIDFMISYPLQDEYGNSTDTTVLKATYTYESRSKINWDDFLWENIPNVADEWWMHNALKNALNE